MTAAEKSTIAAAYKLMGHRESVLAEFVPVAQLWLLRKGHKLTLEREAEGEWNGGEKFKAGIVGSDKQGTGGVLPVAVANLVLQVGA